MRRLSPYVTRFLVATPATANGVTAFMIPSGLAAAGLLTLPGLPGAIAAFALVQLQLLLDCCDGEVARWRRTFSPKGIYLDQIAHYTTEAALPAALGVRADGGWASIGGWTALGLSASVLIVLLKSETHLLPVALRKVGRPTATDHGWGVPGQGARRVAVREGARLLPFFRPFHAVEASLLVLGAAVSDAVAGDLRGSRVLVVGFAVAAGIAATGHLFALLASDRLK
jgi:phosphatidylglycerophosphate synthase